ncbi:response regulator transcription factor [Sporomusa acidovorans]|uniref:Transcriptional regulatory protein WalR n=1 Tax=Sporomusa acidovorans (strain ATCC 49682 / DSM 3132 / Mol) TaxID=1123286 RepID=A0ABZ3J6M6_SPOA4|nr:response regulator transcription factor [Sporomusa acidovorans]OZC21011.1 transcriptional regulatory protein WalR [Sporomusa acidovorans DSM 3132]SDF18453.1 DNA-binding response regulator, OmpR family, contains REC and winged-helix (wHTH) domain [Sporomusa acidovorans]
MERVLIIEDNNDIAELEKDYLNVNNFDVVITNDGEVGLNRAVNENFDLIILDLMLPKKSGFEICKEIRKVKEIPILMVTAKKEDIDKIRGLGIGADDYIVKPFSPNELVARVKAHLTRYQRLTKNNTSGMKQKIIIGELAIFPEELRVFIGDNEIKLPHKEFELLYFLAANPNKVFSKEFLFDELWHMEAIGDVSTVTVHIKRLREKIEKDTSNPKYIETVWGAGYRFKK